MGHVHHEECTDLLTDLAELFEINESGVGAGAGENQLRLVFTRQFGNLVIIDALGVAGDAVVDDLEVLARKVEPHAVRQMSAVGQVHR